MTLRPSLRGSLIGSIAFGLVVTAALAPSPVATASTKLDSETLGIFVGFDNPSRFHAYERELRTPVRWVVAMTDHSSPAAMKSSSWGQLVKPDALLPGVSDRVNLTLTVPLAFGNANARSTSGQRTIGANLRETAAGRHDADYRTVARNLIAAGYPDAVIRLGHEFDGSWYPWSARGNNEEYIAAFRHVHDVFASESSSFRFEWTGMRASFSTHAPPAYPGDKFVDVVGLDIYYRESQEITDRVWENQFKRQLQSHLSFARARNKPVAYSEWGVGFHDNPRFVELMHSWFASLPDSDSGRLLYQSFFTPLRAAYNLDLKPATKGRYLSLFGGSADRSPAPSPVTLPKGVSAIRPPSPPPPPPPPPPVPPSPPPASSSPSPAPPSSWPSPSSSTTPPSSSTLPPAETVEDDGVAGTLPELAVTTGDGWFSAAWSHPTARLFQFRYRSSADVRWNWDAPSENTARVIDGLSDGVAYDIEVRAYVDGDWRAWSTVTASPLTITPASVSFAEGSDMTPNVSAEIDAGVMWVEWSHPSARLFQFRYRSSADGRWNWDEPTESTSRLVEGLDGTCLFDVEVRLYRDGDWREWSTVSIKFD